MMPSLTAQETETKTQSEAKAAVRKKEAKARAASLRRICDRLEIRPGATVADIGAGKGLDTWVFADIVGGEGRVFAVEISEADVVKLRSDAESRELPQVQAVLGKSDTPELPANSVDLAFMHYVYHHLAKPREMLRSIWQSLKPGGYYVVVDRHKGTLVDWVPREVREKKHHWLAETTFVREAREEGFLFVDFAEKQWHDNKDTFVLIMQRPTQDVPAGRDPDPMPPIDQSVLRELLPADGGSCQRIALIALGEGRKLIKPLLSACEGEAVDIVLEEWATQKDELPDVPAGVRLRSVLTEKGDPKLGSTEFDAVYFLDTYHLLFHGDVLLPALHQRLTDDGRVFVLDRIADEEISHREASHRHMIAPETVQQEMHDYGFELESSSPLPVSSGRFLLTFRKRS
jgi:predicted methyltransferase